MLCRKRHYRDWKAANSALKKLKWLTKGKCPEKSYYECKLCGWWHLSKVKHTPKNIKKHNEIQTQKKIEAEAEYWIKKEGWKKE